MISQKIKEIEREIEKLETGKCKFLTIVLDGVRYDKKIGISQLYVQLQAFKEASEMIENVIDDYFDKFGDVDSIDVNFNRSNIRKELKQKLGVGK